MKMYLKNRLCISALGYNRVIVYDLNRSDYYFIPIEIHEIIETDEVIYSQNLDKDWEEFLLEKEILFEISIQNEREMFPSVSKKYEVPNLLTSIILHENVTKENLDYFQSLHIPNIAVIVDKFNLTFIIELLKKITKLEVDSVYLYLTEQNGKFYRDDFIPLNSISQLNNVYLFNGSTLAHTGKNNKEYNPINILPIPYSFELFLSTSLPEKMQVNYNHFFESYNFHNYYNQKAYIDKDGNLKNGINSNQTFGNVNEMTENDFLRIIDSVEFQKLWTINKKDTLICQDCEFRYMCTDPREPLYDKVLNKWYHKTECTYNPYISKWKHEENYTNLADCGIVLDPENHAFSIDKKKLTAVFNDIWN